MKLSLFALIPSFFLTGCLYTRVEVRGPSTRAAMADPPGRVGRLSYINGPVSFKAAGTDTWVAAILNRPLTVGDEIWTDRDARAELDIGHALARLDSRTNVGILNLDDRGVQIKVAEGTAQIRLRRLDEEDEFEIDTPHAAISLLRTGDYRLEVNDRAETDLIVHAGQAEVTLPAQAFSVRAGQRARIAGTETITYEMSPAPPLDGFDSFCQNRDRRSMKAESLQYVSPYVIGWEDLDEFGHWRVHPAYGRIWTPRVVASGWAPYRVGHWAWIEPWGWTWIDDAPWGFAPFHYGRWILFEGLWVWVPGPIHVRAIYAPALVIFIGGGPGLHYYYRVGAGLGVAWFPLGPREVYIPPYRCSRVYVTNVNVSHTVIAAKSDISRMDIARQHYSNRAVDGAVTAVPEDVFTAARQVWRSALEISPREAAVAHIGGTAPPVTPTRRSITQEPDANRPAPRPPDNTLRRPVTVRRPPAETPVPLDRKREVLERNPGRPPDPASLDPLRRREPRPSPEYRPVRPPEPVPRKVEAPRREQPTQRNTEQRRRTIEQERQKTTGGRSGRGK